MSLLDLPKFIKRRLIKEYVNKRLFKKNIAYLAKENYIEIIKKIDLDITILYKPDIYFTACYYGYKNIIEFLISKGFNDWDGGLYRACYSGNTEIIELIISKGANDWNEGLRGACQGGYMNIVELMISKGANDWNLGLEEAIFGDQKNMVELMLTKPINNHFIWKNELGLICYNEQKEILELLLVELERKHIWIDFNILYHYCKTQEMKEFVQRIESSVHSKMSQ